MSIKFDGTPKGFMSLGEEDRLTVFRLVCFGDKNISVDEASYSRISEEVMGLGKYLEAWKSAAPNSFKYQTAEMEVHSKILQCSQFCKGKNGSLHNSLEAFRRPFMSKS